jgi:hypothetical protein
MVVEERPVANAALSIKTPERMNFGQLSGRSKKIHP